MKETITKVQENIMNRTTINLLREHTLQYIADAYGDLIGDEEDDARKNKNIAMGAERRLGTDLAEVLVNGYDHAKTILADHGDELEEAVERAQKAAEEANENSITAGEYLEQATETWDRYMEVTRTWEQEDKIPGELEDRKLEEEKTTEEASDARRYAQAAKEMLQMIRELAQKADED